MLRNAALVSLALLLNPFFGSGLSAQTTKRTATKLQTGELVTQHVSANRALSSRLPEIKLGDVRLEDAIAFLQDTSGANIHVNWRALQTVKITRQTPVTLRMQSQTLRSLLKYLMMEVDGEALATFYADDGVIEITTRELADARLVTKVYPVHDLLLTIPDFTDAPSFSLQSPQVSGGGAGQSLLGNTAAGQDNVQVSKLARGERLVRLVQDTVQPEIWRENGGSASIRFFRGRLIVTAPRSVHEQIGGAVD